MRHFSRGQNRSHWVQWHNKLCMEIWRKEENCVSCTNTMLTLGVSMHGFPLEESLNRQWTGFVQRLRPSKTSVLCSVHFAPEWFFKGLILLATTQKGDTVRGRFIEGAVPTNANNSTTKSRRLKSLFRGGRFSKEVLAVGNNGGGKISCCFFDYILKFFRSAVCCEERKSFAQLMTSLGPRILSHVFPDVGPTLTQ